MIEYHKYRGHEIRIQVLEVAPGRFRWAWKIDGVHASKCREVLASEEVARSEAFLYAQVMVARLRNAQKATAEPVAERARAEAT